MAKNRTRRSFLQAAPLAAVATIPLAEKLFAASSAPSEGANAAPGAFQLFTADKLADSVKAFQAQLGEHYLYQPQDLPLTIAITSQGPEVLTARSRDERGT